MDIVEHDQQRFVGRRLQQHARQPSMMRRRRALGPRPAQPVTGPTRTVASRRTEFGDRRRDTMQHSDGSKFIC